MKCSASEQREQIQDIYKLGATLPQVSVLGSDPKESDSLEAVKLPELIEYSQIFLPVADSPIYSENHPFIDREVSDGTEGNRRHFVYHGDDSAGIGRRFPATSPEDYQDSSQVVRACLVLFSETLSRRLYRAMIELVGIEPNPGPSTAMVLVGRKSAAEIRSSTLRSASQAKGKKKGKKKVKKSELVVLENSSGMSRRTGGQVRSGVSVEKLMYQRNLCNPFDFVPVRLGGETMQPSGIATLTARFTQQVPGTGDFSFVYYPWANNNTFLASGSSSTPYTYVPIGAGGTLFPGGNALSSIASGGRIISAGIRVFTLASATTDQGLVTIGCLPRSYSAGTTITKDGFPLTNTSVATQGFNEFNNYLSTESYPLRCGASAFWRPEDPLDFTFRTEVINGNDGTLQVDDPIMPFFVIGINGAEAASNVFIECVSHIEYTVNEGTVGVVSTGMGTMSSVDSFAAAKAVMGNLIDTTMQGIAGGLLQAASAAARNTVGRLTNPGSFFESTAANR